MKRLAILAVSALLLSACASGPAKEEVAATIAAAKAESKAAKKAGFLWRDTGKTIKKAEAALEDGDTAKAMKLAKKAETQGKLAQIQAKDQANAKPAF